MGKDAFARAYPRGLRLQPNPPAPPGWAPRSLRRAWRVATGNDQASEGLRRLVLRESETREMLERLAHARRLEEDWPEDRLEPPPPSEESDGIPLEVLRDEEARRLPEESFPPF